MYHREIAELAAVLTSTQVTDKLRLPCNDPPVVLATWPTNIVR